MCNYNLQSQETKEFLHLFMTKAAQKVGGINFLLGLIETIKTTKPHPLLSKHTQIESQKVTLQWNKVIFKDKFDLLESIIVLHKSSQSEHLNILDIESPKKRKKVFNMVRTLAPIEFIVKPKNDADGEGFSFLVFETIKEDYVKLNPIFVAFFFCSVEFTKKALKQHT